MTLRIPPVALGLAGFAIAPFLHAQPASLPPATQAAVNARRDELARQAKAETDAAIARRNAGQMPERLRTTVGAVQEQRTSMGTGQLVIQLTIFQEDIPAGATIRGHKIIAALDNLDRPIVPSTNPAGGPGGAVALGARAGRAAAPAAPTASRSLMFQAPSRKAESIKLIEGEIEVLMPGDNTSARIPAFASFSGKVVPNAVLAKNEIEITSLTKEMLDPLRATWSTSAAATAAVNPDTSVLLLVKDPQARVVSISLLDATGNPLQRLVQMRNTNAVGVALADLQVGATAGIPATAQLSVVIAAPEAIKTYPFRLENIPLP